jgi:AAA15 family ATPase/GTPase
MQNMLIQFDVGNYKSFKDVVTFSMVAAQIKAKDKRLDENNVFKVDDELNLLKSTAIYGANASGKSNFISAASFMKKFVLGSSKDTQAEEVIPVEPFRLNTETACQPSSFEMVFIIDDRRYRYGFEVTSEKVVTEWLFHVPTIREAKLFERHDGKIEVTAAFKEGKELIDKTRDNALFLSVAAQFNGTISKKILQWFKHLGIISGLDDMGLRAFTVKTFDNNKYRDEILRLVKKLDVGVEDIQLRKSPLTLPLPLTDKVPDEFKGLIEELKKISSGSISSIEHMDILTAHQKFNANGQIAGVELFDIDENESEGTNKIFSMAGPLVDTLKNGEVLLVDELDARLHPLVTRAIINLFNSNETNPQNAQLIFATHDTNLLSKDIFRRDQIWFAEKDTFSATHLYSLVEYKVRNDASFESDYIQGRYGAIPFIGNLSRLLEAPDE